MGKRKFVLVEELEIVGGRLCLDFVNTTGARASGKPRERLCSYRDLLVWSRRTGIISPDEERALIKRAEEDMPGAEQALEHVRDVREYLYALLRTVVAGERPSPEQMHHMNELWHADQRRRELVLTANGFALRCDDKTLDHVLSPVVQSAVELLTDDALSRVKRCGECDWLFLDSSKVGSRRWCKMKGCGDRAKARRYYARKRGSGPNRSIAETP